MRVITINLPQSYIKALNSISGKGTLYPSRSELIRIAVREFLIKEVESAKKFDVIHKSLVIKREEIK